MGHMPVYSIRQFWIHRRTAGNVNPEVFFSAHSFEHQKGVGQGNEGDMMMASPPGATLGVLLLNTLHGVYDLPCPGLLGIPDHHPLV